LPVSYPRVYPNAASFVKQADSFASRGKYAINKDFIYFDESDYSRSANREEFLLSVIKKAFGDRTFDVNLQPMVNANDKQIYGAELLLRIVDEYRNTTFRTDELVNIAAKHDQIAIISHALLDYIKVLYKDYGAVFFASLGFKRLALNTDYSFFTDKNFRNDIKKYLDEIKMPKHFLAFEIPESDVANHMNEFKEIAKMTKEFNIVLVCDQYTGRFVSVEMLKEIGFNEVKISRNLVLHIDSDNQRANALKQLLALIKRLDLKASIVGVENIDQYLLIKDADNTALLQGFYFYRPLEKQALIETVRGTNRRVQQEEPKNN
ncbi:MAG: EAL domain-containing protein, partial [Bacilli bacterium]|nr:EAL domain-containing protein [Bacilli bacterium]